MEAESVVTDPTGTTLDRAWRDERPKIVGSLTRRFGDLSLAEDAVQEAFAAAVRTWPGDGVPDRPGAWLMTTAYRKAIGMLRKRRPTTELDPADASFVGEPDVVDADEVERVSDDDLFALVLGCCHPALAPEARVALTLRHVCGLSVPEISAAFLVPEATMAKRLVRARHKIKSAGISFDPPTGSALAARLDDVRTVVYLVFNEGYLAADGDRIVRSDLCEEAIWLARHLGALHPDDETAGLLALMLVLHARRDARLGPDGALVPFASQDRSRWDHDAIAEARSVMSSTSGRDVGRYQVEAAIALLHVTGTAPDWARIADLYTVLARVAPSPVVDVNRALAVGYADGAPAGLAVLEPVLAAGRLEAYAPLHAVRAELLELAGRTAEARRAWEHSAALSTNPSQRDRMLVRAAAAHGDRPDA